MLGSTIVIVFSESLLSSTVNTTNFLLIQNSNSVIQPASVTLGSDLKTVTITPSSSLANSTVYKVRVTTGVKDLANNSFATQAEWTFTTIAATYTIVYNVAGANSYGNLDVDRIAAGLRQMDFSTQSDSLYQKVIKKVVVYMNKVGNPAAGTIYCRVRNFDSPATIKATLGSVASSTVNSTSDVTITFENAANTYLFDEDDCLLIEYTAGTSTSILRVKRKDSDVWGHGQAVNYDGTIMRSIVGYDLAGIVYV